MSKNEFLSKLRSALYGLPEEDINERISFYSEMIDDRVEEGLTEEEAVSEIEPIDQIVSQTISDVPLRKLVKERIKPKHRLGSGEIVIIILGFPLWLPLIITFIALIFTMYAVLWSLIIALWAVELSFGVTSIAGFISAAIVGMAGNNIRALALLGIGLLFAGITLLLFYGCIEATKGMAILTKKAFIMVKKMFIRKETK